MDGIDIIDKIGVKLGAIRRFAKKLAVYRGLTEEKLAGDEDTALKVERLFELACEAVLDVSRMMVSDQRYKIPEDSKGYILRLGEEGVLDAEFSKGFAGMAGFRNILVHDYLNIDYKEVADKLNRLGDFERFASEVAKYYELKVSG